MRCRNPRRIKVLIFCGLFCLLFLGANRVFRPKWFEWNHYYTYNGFYEEPEDSIETVFLGSSVVLTGVSPVELYNSYGICSYNLAGEQQPVFGSYYWLQEAYRLHPQTLKTVVLDASMMVRVPADAFYRKALDPMRLSPLKLQALWDYTEGNIHEVFEHLIPFFSYHARWAELTANDFAGGRIDCDNGTRGQHVFLGHHIDSTDLEHIGLLGWEAKDAACLDFHEEALRYFEKTASFCRDKGLQLVLIKTPTDAWNDGYHNAAVDLAQAWDIPFWDFNTTPLYEELDYSYPFDNADGTHLNLGGSQKLTAALGRRLAASNVFTDVRGSALGRHMEEQQQLYQENAILLHTLSSAEDITACLSAAVESGCTVLLSVRDEGVYSLTEQQRQSLVQLGLKQLAVLGYRESYLAVMGENGITEEVKPTGRKDSGPLTRSIDLYGRFCIMTSGGLENGDISSVCIDGTEYSKNQRGINVVIYSPAMEAVVFADAFDTHAESRRDVYTADMGARAAASALLCLCRDPITYLETALAGENVILIAVRDEASAALTEEQRRRSGEMGLPRLSELGYRESYLAVLDGDLRMEQSGELPLTDSYTGEDGVFSLGSSGLLSGDSASLCVNGVEYAGNRRGLNILVYSKELDAVIDSVVFDTCASPERRPFTLENLSVYELNECSIYELVQLYEATRYAVNRTGEGGGL